MDETPSSLEYPAVMATAPLETALELLRSMGKEADASGPQGQNVYSYLTMRANEEEGVQLLEECMKMGIPADHMDDNNQTAIFYAAREGHLQCLQFLKMQGLQVTLLDGAQQSALYYAAREGRTEIMDWLVAEGIDLNHVDANGDPALFYAARDNRLETVVEMLRLGADPTIKDANGHTAAFIARRMKHKKLEAKLDAAEKSMEKNGKRASGAGGRARSSAARHIQQSSDQEIATTTAEQQQPSQEPVESSAVGRARRRCTTTTTATSSKRAPPATETTTTARRSQKRRRDTTSQSEGETDPVGEIDTGNNGREDNNTAAGGGCSEVSHGSKRPRGAKQQREATTKQQQQRDSEPPVAAAKGVVAKDVKVKSEKKRASVVQSHPSLPTTTTTETADSKPPIAHSRRPSIDASCVVKTETESATEVVQTEEVRQRHFLQYLGPLSEWTFATRKKVEEFEALFPEMAVWPQSAEMRRLPIEVDRYRRDWHMTASDMMQHLLSTEGSFLFAEPVDPVRWKIPHYRDVVKNPMDFATVLERIKSGTHYETITALFEDIELVFHNCILFNTTASEVGRICLGVREEFVQFARKSGLFQLYEAETAQDAESDRVIRSRTRRPTPLLGSSVCGSTHARLSNPPTPQVAPVESVRVDDLNPPPETQGYHHLDPIAVPADPSVSETPETEPPQLGTLSSRSTSPSIGSTDGRERVFASSRHHSPRGAECPTQSTAEAHIPAMAAR